MLRTLTIDKVTSTSIELANKVYTYLLITTPINYTIETNLFSYNTMATSTLCYILTVFMGIIIDIGALKKLTTSYGQYQVL